MDMESKEQNKKFGIRRFLKSFKYSYDGLKYAYKYEQSMILHAVASIVVFILGIFLRISLLEWAFCISTLALILSIELLNTAIEAVVDLASPEIHPLAKIAKDTGSAASGVYSIFSVFTLGLIFIPKIIALF